MERPVGTAKTKHSNETMTHAITAAVLMLFDAYIVVHDILLLLTLKGA